MQLSYNRYIWLPNSTKLEPYRPIEVSGAISASERLLALEAQLSQAEASYDDQHPDIIRLRKQVEAVRTQVNPEASRRAFVTQLQAAEEERLALLERYGEDHPDVKANDKKITNLRDKLSLLPEKDVEPNNPNYLSIKARLDIANSEVYTMQVKEEEAFGQTCRVNCWLDAVSIGGTRVPCISPRIRSKPRQISRSLRERDGGEVVRKILKKDVRARNLH